ncbi:MAG: hypothetical protein HQL23_04740 [Candidatus Omnitrophica bacterium]|nr:hypothetical protein [Candidatus Omnitrophota bacterium]
MKKGLWIILALTVALTGCGQKKTDLTQTDAANILPNVDYVAQGMEMLREKKIPEAIQSFNYAVRQDPKNPEKYLFVSDVYTRMKYYQGAIDVLRAGTAAAPQNGDLFFRLSLTYYLRDEAGDLANAEAAVGQCLQIFLEQKNKDKFELAHALYQDIKKKQIK